MQPSRLEIILASALPPDTFDGEWRGPIEFAQHYALLNLGNVLGCHAETKYSGEGHLLPLQTLHTFESFINVRLNTYLYVNSPYG